MTTAPALDGIRVLDLATVGPAARCTRILADYGARVVKVGAPAGRQIEPAWWAYGAGRGMERIRLARLGIGYEDLRGVNEGLVYCSTSGYGQDGPRAGWAGHDLNYLAVGGYLHLSGRRADGGPALPGATVADSAAGGMQAAVAILAALVRRAASGRGAYLDVSVADGVLSLTGLAIDEHLSTGVVPGPGRDLLTGRYACYDVYEARDGGWLAVAAIEPVFFANLCRALGLERFVAHHLDDARQEEIRAAFREAFAKRDRDEWAEELGPADTCVAPVLSIEELVHDPQFRHRGAFVDAERPAHGRFRQLGPVLAGATPPSEECT
jgi:alpha-methylacyl-CoA racemase